MIRVYKYGCLAPTARADMVRAQLRAAHEYRNDLIAIERGRRWVMRQILDASAEVQEAISVFKSATRSDRQSAQHALIKARNQALAAEHAEVDRINDLDASIRRDARALTHAHWGTYLGVEAAADAARKAPLYDEDFVTPHEPRFLRSRHLDAGDWSLGTEGTLGVQIQSTRPLTVGGLLAGEDTRARLRVVDRKKNGRAYGEISIRIGSEGRQPIWATWPIKLHRPLPRDMRVSWVRVSCRHELLREVWTCEITLEQPKTQGAIAVDLCWEDAGDSRLRVARWHDSDGAKGETLLPNSIKNRLEKSASIRALRDILRNNLLVANEETGTGGTLPREMRKCGLHLRTDWLGDAARTIHAWRSQERLHRLRARWCQELPDVAPTAFSLLDHWARGSGAKHDHGDMHLWRYETGVRSNALGERREIYRLLAREWAAKYETVIFDGADLRRAAQFGPDSDLRFACAPSELAREIESVFGGARISVCLRDKDDPREWTERAIEQWRAEQTAGGARNGNGVNGHEKSSGAWSRRKAAKAARAAARKQDGNDAKSKEV